MSPALMSVLKLAGPVLDVDVKRPRKIDCWGVDECSAVAADIAVVPVFWKPQPGNCFFHFYAVPVNVRAVEAGVAGSVLINSDCSKRSQTSAEYVAVYPR